MDEDAGSEVMLLSELDQIRGSLALHILKSSLAQVPIRTAYVYIYMPENPSTSHRAHGAAAPILVCPRAKSSRQPTPDSMRQGLVRVERVHEAVVSSRRPLVVGADGRRVAQYQVGDHAPEHDAAVVVEVRPVVGGEVVLLRGVLADGVDERERRLVQVDVR